MKLATWVFRIAGIYGLLVIPPMYFLEKQIAIDDPPAITHPEFFYGFAGVTLAWQVAFLIIGHDPVRFRPLMIPAMIEKFSFVIAIGILYGQQRVTQPIFVFSMLDALLGVLFVLAFFFCGVAKSKSGQT